MEIYFLNRAKQRRKIHAGMSINRIQFGCCQFFAKPNQIGWEWELKPNRTSSVSFCSVRLFGLNFLNKICLKIITSSVLVSISIQGIQLVFNLLFLIFICMYVCIYTCIHACLYVYICVYIFLYI